MNNEVFEIIKERAKKAESKLYAQIEDIITLWKDESKRNLEEQIKFIKESINVASNEICKVIKEKAEKAEGKLHAQIEDIITLWKEESKRNLEEQIKSVKENINVVGNEIDELIKEKAEKAVCKLHAQIEDIITLWKEEAKRNLEGQVKFIRENINSVNSEINRLIKGEAEKAENKLQSQIERLFGVWNEESKRKLDEQIKVVNEGIVSINNASHKQTELFYELVAEIEKVNSIVSRARSFILVMGGLLMVNLLILIVFIALFLAK